MATAKKKTTKAKAKPAAKAAATATKTVQETNKAVETGMEQFTEYAGKFGEYAEDGMKVMAERAAASTEVMRELGARNMDFFTKTLEHSVETTQALSSVKDPRQMMELQSDFGKYMLNAYSTEMTAQAEMVMGAWREAAKPFMTAFK